VTIGALRHYLRHRENCGLLTHPGPEVECSCGLNTLLREFTQHPGAAAIDAADMEPEPDFDPSDEATREFKAVPR